jgi:ABC-type nitrate/sulfonate/bicarbonate transport system permease component
MIIHSIASSLGESPSINDFLVGFFFFFLTSGLTAGIFISTLEHYPFFQSLLISAAGLVAGYALGILAGFGLQYIGWLAALLDPLAGLMVFGMLVLDMVLLSGTLFR